MIDSRIEIHGLKEALKELSLVDKKAKWAAVREIKTASGKLIGIAQQPYPTNGDVARRLPGAVHKGRTGYDQSKAYRGIKIKVGGRRTRQGEPVVTLVQQDPGAMIYQVAGMRGGSQGKPNGPDRLGRKRKATQSTAYIEHLQRDFGRYQRGYWQNYKQLFEEAQGQVMDAVRRVAAQVNRKIVTK